MAQLLIVAQQPSVELPVESRDSSGSSQKIIVGFKRYKTKESQEKVKEYEAIVEAPDFDLMNSPELDEFIKGEILYIKKLSLTVLDEETQKEKVIKVLDTRKAQTVETLWESPEECLDVLLDSYFQWTSWRVSFIQQAQAALVDTDYEAALRKNY